MKAGMLVAPQGDERKREEATSPRPDRHPWLIGLEWFVDASDRLLGALGEGSTLVIGLDRQKDREPTAGVQVESAHTDDELDDMPGLRRIERRATEIARHLPAKPPFGARVAVTRDDIAVHLRWHHPGSAALVAHRRPDGWHAADMVIMPTRHLRVPDRMLLTRDPMLLEILDRGFGGGRLDTGAYIHSATRRDEEIRLVVSAGAIRMPVG